MIPPKRFDIFPPDWGDAQKVYREIRSDLSLKNSLPRSKSSVWGTRFSMLDCHVLKGFGIYMIGILDRRY